MSRNRRPISRQRSRELAAPTVAAPASNGNGAGPPADVMRQVSFSGTPSYAGMTRPDDYVSELQEPVRRMQTFEEMRFSDDAIHGAISAREHMIQSSNWALQPPDDSAGSREVLEFAEDNIYPFLDEILSKLSGAIQYGFAAIEPVYGWSDAPTVRNYIKGGARQDVRKWGRKIFLQKIANPLQRTIYTFRINAIGDLQAVEQYAWNGFTFLRNLIPPHKLILWSYNKRGDDFWGIPPTRHAYKAWTFKKQLEALNALGIDRFGAGTPVAEAGPAWNDQDYIKLEQYLKHWRVSDESFLIHPAGGKISLMSGDGSMTMATLDWVKYYKLCIAMTYLTQGSELGSTDTGSRALGEVMMEQSETVVQGDDEQIASIVNQQIVVPLIDWNFGAQEAYPQFIPSQRVRASSAIGTVITSLIAARAIKWEPKDEAWLRDAMHLPSIDLKARQAEYEEQQQLAKQAAQAAADAGADPNAPASDPAVVGKIGPKDDPASAERNSARKQRALSIATPGIGAMIGQSILLPNKDKLVEHRTREYNDWEAEVLRPMAVARDLDTQVLRLTGEAHDLLQSIDENLVSQIGRYADAGVDALSGAVRKLAVTETDRGKLRRVMMGAATRARAYGDNAVMMEDARQQGLDPNGIIIAPRIEFASDEKAKDAQLKAAVDGAAEDEASRREAAIRSAVLLAIHMAGTLAASELLKQAQTAARDNLQNLSVTRLEDNMQQVVNTGFGIGRRDGATRLGDAIKAKVYSAVMDGGTCDACAPYDGAMYPADYPEDATGVQAPNPKCYGRGRCRCVWMYVTNAELPSATPAERGADTGLSNTLVRETERTRSMLERFLDATVRRERDAKPPVVNVEVKPAEVNVRPNITVQMPPEKERPPLAAELTRDEKGNARVTISTVGGKVMEGRIVKDPVTGKKTIKMEQMNNGT